MSGHSKWHKIKHQKEATDKKKGLVFGKFAREIATAARSEKDPAKNAALRDIIARAKKANMPQANIDRLLSGSSEPLQAVTYEAFGPGSSALIITAETDNSNRTLTEVKVLLRDVGGHLGGPNTVRWKFSPDLKPLYPVTLSLSDKGTLEKLISDLTNHPDITGVHTVAA
jgi:transcriptional/translational regulatory protein YebC/TACO1